MLIKAIESVLKQSWQVHELLVIDNGSNDGTREDLKKKYPDVKSNYEDKRGVSAARNKGIRIARGNWIAFLDSDDEWNPLKLEEQIMTHQRNEKNHRFIHTNEIWYQNGIVKKQKKKHKKSGGDLFKNSLDLCCISPSSAMVRRDLLDEVGYFDESLPACEDYDLWLRITAKDPVLFVEKPLTIKNGGHKDQLSKQYWGMDRFRIRSLEKILRSGILNKKQTELTMQVLFKKIKILIDGSIKRQNFSLYKNYSEKLEYWKCMTHLYEDKKEK